MYRYFCTVFALSLSLALSTSLVATANVQNPTAALTQASKLLEQGQSVQSIALIDRTLQSGNVPSNLAAKAMLLRAQAQESLGKHAFALADYNSALWMQGLSRRDRGLAEQGRQRIMTYLGVEGVPQVVSAQPVVTGSSWGTEVKTTETEKRTGGFGSISSGVLGASQGGGATNRNVPASVQPVAVSADTGQNQAPVAQLAPVAPSNGFASNGARPQPVQEIIIAQSAQSGEFAIQFSAVRSEDSALYEADRIGKRYGEFLGGRTPSIKIRGTEDGGTLYKIIAQPYVYGEGVATCELLKTKGVSCMLISR